MTLTQRHYLTALWLLALTVATGLAGCGARAGAVQAPAGMRVGPALTQAQVQAIQKKRGVQQGN